MGVVLFFLFTVSSPERLNNCLLDTESTPHRKILTDFWEGCEELLRISLKKKPWTLNKSIYSIITYLPSLSWCSEKIQKTKLHYHWYLAPVMARSLRLCCSTIRLLERYTELGQLLQLVWQRWLRWRWSLGEDDLFSTEILLNVILCSCLRSSGLFLSMAVRLLARLLMSLLSYLLMEHSLLVVSIHLLYPGLHKLKDWNRGI